MQVTYNQFRQVHPRDWTEVVEVLNHGKVIGFWTPAEVQWTAKATSPDTRITQRLEPILPARTITTSEGIVADPETGEADPAWQTPISHNEPADDYAPNPAYSPAPKPGKRK